VCGD